MDARSRKLCACLGYSIRLAGKSDLDEVSQMLWQALHLVTAKVDGRIPLSLFSALDEKGLQVQIPRDHDADSKEHFRSGKEVGGKPGLHTQADDARTATHATQTEVEVISRPQFETIMGTTMERVSELQGIVNSLQLRLATVEKEPDRRGSTWSPSVMPEALEVDQHSAPSSSCMVPHAVGNVLAVEETSSERTLLTSFEDLKEAHRQERLALRQQRRHDRNLRMARCIDPEPDT
ncbi:unnamed protein product [Symbiodinium sp. CCMP2592]|nr:unnamed protein product [Symbiodinium sp. CCMP2592]